MTGITSSRRLQGARRRKDDSRRRAGCVSLAFPPSRPHSLLSAYHFPLGCEQKVPVGLLSVHTSSKHLLTASQTDPSLGSVLPGTGISLGSIRHLNSHCALLLRISSGSPPETTRKQWHGQGRCVLLGSARVLFELELLSAVWGAAHKSASLVRGPVRGHHGVSLGGGHDVCVRKSR